MEKTKDPHIKIKRKLFDPAWLDDFVLMQLFKDTNGALNYDIIRRERFKKVLRWHSSIQRLREWEAAQGWYGDRKAEIEKTLAPVPGQRLVNREAVLKDHMEGKEDPVTAFLLGKPIPD